MSWISEITGVDVDVNAGTVTITAPRPDKIFEALKNLPADVIKAIIPGAMVLASEIRRARAQIRPFSSNMPRAVEEKLMHYFPYDIIDRTRFAIYDPNRMTIDSLILGFRWEEVGATAIAVTLDDVVVFKEEGMQHDIPLWAHELIHVTQYQNLGVEGFAATYIIARNSLEDPAYEFGAKVKADVAADLARKQACDEYKAARAAGLNPVVQGDRDPCGNCVKQASLEQLAMGQNGCGERANGAIMSWDIREQVKAKWDSLVNPGIPLFEFANAVRVISLERADTEVQLGNIDKANDFRRLADELSLESAGDDLRKLGFNVLTIEGINKQLRSLGQL
jgi:hypothetical protein